MIAIASPLLGREEQEAVQAVLLSGQLAQGAQVAAFEQRFAAACGVQEAIAVSSGTAALHLALLAHGIGVGDEVITSSFSFAATANAIVLAGAKPVFVDIDPDTYTLDPALVEKAITLDTRAIIPVHLYGHPCDMERLGQVAAAHQLVLIEDACQAHLATFAGKPVGGFGTGCFSFYATKNMTTGEGGMITTNDSLIAQRLRLFRSHGQQERYRHVTLGQNLRMTEMQAALGLVQLEKLPQFTEQRQLNAAFLTSQLKSAVQTPITLPNCTHVYHQYTIRVSDGQRDEWAKALKTRDIGTAVHYPTPIHQQPFYRDFLAQYGITDLELPETETAAKEVLSLPVHPALGPDNLAKVAKEVLKLCN